jgi:hypothetical protein
MTRPGQDVRGFYAALGVQLPGWAQTEASVRCFTNPDAHQHDDRDPSCSVNVKRSVQGTAMHDARRQGITDHPALHDVLLAGSEDDGCRIVGAIRKLSPRSCTPLRQTPALPVARTHRTGTVSALLHPDSRHVDCRRLTAPALRRPRGYDRATFASRAAARRSSQTAARGGQPHATSFQ